MKTLLCLCMLLLATTAPIWAQSMAVVPPAKSDPMGYSPANFSRYYTRPKGTIALISAGSGLMGAGGVTVLYGALVAYSAYGKNNIHQDILDRGHKIEAVGGIAGVMGLTMIIVATSRVHTARYGKWSMVIPGKKEAGIAYNF